MLIGLTAKNAAGKDEVARCLVERHGFSYFSLSDLLREELKKQGCWPAGPWKRSPARSGPWW